MRRRVLVGCVLGLAAFAVSACGKRPAESQRELPTKGLGDNDPGRKSDAEADKLRDENRRKRSVNLLGVAIGMHEFHDAFLRFPYAASAKEGKVDPNGLSWRVWLLFSLSASGESQTELYKQFHLDEPWDSEHNKKLIPKMPKIFAAPGTSPEEGKTCFKVFVGPDTPFPMTADKFLKLEGIEDGVSNTIMFVESGPPVIWTKLDDIVIDLKKPLPDLSFGGDRKINIVMFDGARRTLDLDKVSEDTLKAVITPNGREVIGPDWDTGAPLLPKK